MSDSAHNMTPNRPYMVRAMHEWILDNDLTPHIIVDAGGPDVAVPSAYVVDGKIVLNISPGAVRDLAMENHAVTFSARFSGKSHAIYVPISAVLAIFARENGVGMAFQDDAEDDGPRPPDNTPERPKLRVVK